MADELKATQADRDAAADCREEYSGKAGSFSARLYREGRADNTVFVQAFARHRIATETQSQATIEELVGALERCRNRFHRCIISGGTDEEYADAAVAEYDTILSRHKGEGQ